jgi:UTP--glucose-1-phosphate uridylyltransferase
MTYELEVALEQAGKHELLDVVRSVKPDDMECIYVRQAQALGLGHAVLCGQRLVGNEPFAVLLADDLMVGDTPVLQADGRAVRRVARVHPGRAGSAGRAHPALRHRGRQPGQRAAGRRDAHRREARARGRPVAPGRGRPLHPDARRVPRNRQPAARRGRRDPAHRRHRSLLRREKVFAYRYEGKRYDCGSKEGFLQANVELALQHPECWAPASAPTCKSAWRSDPGAPAQRRRSRCTNSLPTAGLLDQFVAGLARKGLESRAPTGVGGHHLQHLAAACPPAPSWPSGWAAGSSGRGCRVPWSRPWSFGQILRQPRAADHEARLDARPSAASRPAHSRCRPASSAGLRGEQLVLGQLGRQLTSPRACAW